MGNIFGKLGSYQLLVNLLPGAFFVLALNFFFGLTLPLANIVEDILAYYFIGIIINRVGSLIVEPAIKNLGFIKEDKEDPDTNFIKAEKVDAKISTLLETHNMIRSLLTSVLLIPVVRGVIEIYLRCQWFSMNWEWFAIAFLVCLFLFSYKKQTNYINKRIKEANNQGVQAKSAVEEMHTDVEG